MIEDANQNMKLTSTDLRNIQQFFKVKLNFYKRTVYYILLISASVLYDNRMTLIRQE